MFECFGIFQTRITKDMDLPCSSSSDSWLFACTKTVAKQWQCVERKRARGRGKMKVNSSVRFEPRTVWGFS